MSDATSTNMPPKLVIGRAISFSCLLGLILLYSVTSWIHNNPPIIYIIPCLTLVIFLPGMMRNQHRSYNWLCFVILIHFTVAVTGVMSELSAWNDWVQLCLTISLFNAAMMTSRWLQAWRHSMHEQNNDTPS